MTSLVLLSTIMMGLFPGSPPGTGEPPALADAALRAVQMVDAHEGWAVGDDGLILHTIDGGKSWERQASGTQGSLRGLHFADPFHGFIVGREEGNFGLDSWGILLYTNDGGVKWNRIAYRETPGLFGIQFVDADHGFLLAEGSASQPSGLYQTGDGGQSWSMVQGEHRPAVLAAAFRDPQHGLLGGPHGLSLMNRGQLMPHTEPMLANRGVRAMKQIGSTIILAGERGLLLRSDNGGVSWHQALQNLSDSTARSWDFHALAMHGDRVWVAGRPGSVILHSWDAGKTWQVQPTGQTMPLHAIQFIDDQKGWAVGALGTVLATTDGGRTWNVQRRGGHRMAAMVVSANGQHLPVGTLALQGGDEGYLISTLQVGHTPWRHARRTHAEARLNEAVRKARGSQSELLTSFPLPAHLEECSQAEIATFWSQGQSAKPPSEEQGMALLEEQLVLALRIWRPDVVITDCPLTTARTGAAGALVAYVTKRACEKAGLADAYPEHFAKFDLKPWSPSKLYGRWEDSEEIKVVYDLENCRPMLLASANEVAAASRTILQPNYELPPEHEYFRLLWSAMEDAEQHTALMQGVQLERGGQARRLAVEFDQDAFESATKASGEMHDVYQRLRKMRQSPILAGALIQTIENMLANLDEERAGEALFALGQEFIDLGQWPQAKEVFIMMLDRYPAHRLALEAARWNALYSSSSLAKLRSESKQFSAPITYDFRPPPKPNRKNLPTDPTKLDVKDLGVKRPPLTVLQKRRDDLREWYKGGLCFGEVLSALSPNAKGDPRVQFGLHAAHRRLGEHAQAHLWYTQYVLHPAKGPWMDAALAELWLAKPQGPCPKPILSSTIASQPPYLDGLLDDPCWQKAKPMRLKDEQEKTSAAYRTEARMMHDAKFLYLAVECKHPANGHQVPPVVERERDQPVRGMDRISLLLDRDRSYGPYFQIQVDQRGCVREDAWGDLNWNPQCYVAVKGTETGWIAEVAIPWHELTSDPNQRETWTVNLVRILPGKGVQALYGPADVQPRPEGMTLLQFLDQPEEQEK